MYVFITLVNRAIMAWPGHAMVKAPFDSPPPSTDDPSSLEPPSQVELSVSIHVVQQHSKQMQRATGSVVV
jgi:hypothetical protein